MSESPFLAVKNISKSYTNFKALDNISLSVMPKEFICFLGPSGCGKTTLLRTIAGLEKLDSGEIWQNNINYTSLPPEKRDFGIVFQSYALFPNLTVMDNIGFGLYNQGKKKNAVQKSVMEWLTIIELPHAKDKYPAQLSGGEQQRVALARALALSPSLLLLDEPLSALDAKVRVQLREKILSLQKELGLTTIMVTHDQEEAMAMADRIVVMKQGCVQQIGTPQNIYQKPASRFVAEFVGAINLMDGWMDEQHSPHIYSVKRSQSHCHNKPIFIGVRPEDICFTQENSSFPVRIETLEFQGMFMRAECLPLGWNSSRKIRIDIPIQQLASLQLTIGCHKNISIQEQGIHAFPNT